jgi:hypothetical protein
VYQPRTTIVNDEKRDLVADSQIILAICRNYFSQLLNALGDKEVWQAEIHIVEPLVSERSDFEVNWPLKR